MSHTRIVLSNDPDTTVLPFITTIAHTLSVCPWSSWTISPALASHTMRDPSHDPETTRSSSATARHHTLSEWPRRAWTRPPRSCQTRSSFPSEVETMSPSESMTYEWTTATAPSAMYMEEKLRLTLRGLRGSTAAAAGWDCWRAGRCCCLGGGEPPKHPQPPPEDASASFAAASGGVQKMRRRVPSRGPAAAFTDANSFPLGTVKDTRPDTQTGFGSTSAVAKHSSSTSRASWKRTRQPDSASHLRTVLSGPAEVKWPSSVAERNSTGLSWPRSTCSHCPSARDQMRTVRSADPETTRCPRAITAMTLPSCANSRSGRSSWPSAHTFTRPSQPPETTRPSGSASTADTVLSWPRRRRSHWPVCAFHTRTVASTPPERTRAAPKGAAHHT